MLEVETFIFFFSLLACVPLGGFYKQIEDVRTKRNLGAGIGVLLAVAICGPHVYYTIFLVSGNIITITYCDKRSVHLISLLFTWLFLLYLHFYVNCSKYATWLFQNMALRLVGLAFEINICDKNINKDDKKPMQFDEECHAICKLTPTNIASYAYFFIGLHKGPYYTWKTLNDHFSSPISVRGEFRTVTGRKLAKASVFALAYLLIRLKYPLSMYEEKEFYVNYGTDYRFLSCMPQLVLYVLEYQIMLMVSTSVYTEAGFGVYPVKCLAVPGAGPTVPYKLTVGTEDSKSEEYNFSMLKCFNNEQIVMGPKMKDTVRGWDMSTRYWFSQYVVKNLVKSNFEVRSACSFLFWTIWVGPTVQNMIIALTLWVYIHLEAEYAQMYADSLRGPWDLGFAIMRMLCLFYLTPCFIIDDKHTALKYYNSIYWVYHIVLAVLTLVAIGLQTSSRFGKNLNESAKVNTAQKLTIEQTGPSTVPDDNVAGKEVTRKLSDTGSTRSRVGTSDNTNTGPSTSGNNADTSNNPKK